MDSQFEMSDGGSFRIRVEEVWSEWVGYPYIAVLKKDNRTFIAVSAYFEDNVNGIPVEKVLEVKEV